AVAARRLSLSAEPLATFAARNTTRVFHPANHLSGFLVTWGNGTFVPHIVLMHGCSGRIPAPEWGFGGSLLLFAGDLGRICQAVVGHECPTHTVHRMENALGNSLAALSSSRKFSARAALVDLQEPSRALLSECFRQFGIESISMTSDKAGRLASEKFEACVIRVGSHAAPVLESARKSR